MWILNPDSTGQGNWVNISAIHKSQILPNKTRVNCWLTKIRFCMASKQQRRTIKTYRGGILLCNQSLTGNNLKGKAQSWNLSNYSDWLTFVVTQIIRMSQVWTLLWKQKNCCYKILNFFANSKPNFSARCEQGLSKKNLQVKSHIHVQYILFPRNSYQLILHFHEIDIKLSDGSYCHFFQLEMYL